MLWATSGALWTCKLAAVPQKVGALDAFREPFGTTWQILAAIFDPAGSQRDPKITSLGQQISTIFVCVRGGWWVGGWVCGLEQFSVSPRPLGFGFGTKGFGARA